MRARLVLVVLAAGLTVLAPACGSDDSGSQGVTTVLPIPGPYDFDYTIPLGTAERIANGEEVDVLPNVMEAKVGQTIRIVNNDTKGHEVGSWYVLAGTSLMYRFNEPGTFIGVCTTHSSGTFTLTVTD